METHRPDGRDGHLFNWAMGIVCLPIGLLFVFMVVVSIVRHESGWNPSLVAGTVWLIVVLLGFGASGIGEAMNLRWANRLGRFVTVLTALGIGTIVIGGLVREPLPPRPLDGLAEVLSVGWIGFGVFLYLTGRRTGEPKDEVTSSPAIIVIWPFLLAMKGLVGFVALLVPFSILGGLYLLLHKLGFRYAVPLLSMTLVSALILILRRRR